ncbi:hypothetical protein AH06_317 [Erwinia phage AH06]|nr:hypothetical protein AH06_317 [Erwinia phage AH06]
MTTVTNSTPLVRLRDMAYPKYQYDARQDNMNVSWGSTTESEKLLTLPNQYAVVYPVDRPDGDVVTEGTPAQGDDGLYYQHWDVRSYNEDELSANLAVGKDIALQDAKNIISNDLNTGIPFTHGETDYQVVMTAEERVNLMGLRVVAEKRVNASDETTFKLRTVAGQMVELTPVEVIDVVEHLLELYAAYLGRYWTFKNNVTSATLIADVPVVPSTFSTDDAPAAHADGDGSEQPA